MPKIEPILDKLVADNNKLYGHKWLACYGGDPYDSSKPDIAAVMKYIGEKGVPVLAVQCSEYGGYMFNKDGVLDENSYSFLAAAAIYETELGTPPMVPNPKKPGAMKKNIQFGGFETDTSHLLGTTHYVFDALFGDKMKGHIACGGGPIALQEMEAAFDRGLRCLYIPTEAKHGVTLGDGYGVMHTWFSQNGLPLSAASSGWGWVKPGGGGAQERMKRKFEMTPWIDHAEPEVNKDDGDVSVAEAAAAAAKAAACPTAVAAGGRSAGEDSESAAKRAKTTD